MSDNQLTIYNSSTSLLVSNSEGEIKEAARKLMRLTPNGTRLNTDQATDLAVYAFITGLNPFNSECYYMDRVGPVPGIAGYRVKTMEWLRATSPSNDSPRVWEEYREANETEADFNKEAGDVAWVCTLYDSVSKERWRQSVIDLGIAYSKMGATFQEAHDTALKDVGECPSWSAVGVVKADEHFSGNVYRNSVKIEGEFKPEMWDRNERAKKRAAKGCYRKGFPAVNIPDREEGDVIDSEFSEVKQQISSQLNAENVIEEEKPKRPASEAIADLFGDPIPYQPEPQPETAPTMSLETAMTAKNADGIPYGDIDSDKLSFMTSGINRGLLKTDLTPEKREEYLFKRDAIKVILQSRNEAH